MSGTKTDQYARNAKGWSDRQYADPRAYLEHRAQLIVELGPPLVKDDEVLDLACGDGGLGEELLRRGLRYRGLDLEPAMVEAAAQRLGDRAVVRLGDLNTFASPGPVAAITVFRAIYYAVDRPAFFARAREQTRGKLVFDLNPRQYGVQTIAEELRTAGFEQIVMRPFLVPQTIRLPRSLAGLLGAAERIPLARVVLRVRFTYVVAAW